MVSEYLKSDNIWRFIINICHSTSANRVFGIENYKHQVGLTLEKCHKDIKFFDF